MLTPLDTKGAVIGSLFSQHAKNLIASGCSHIVPFGTTGESLSVSHQERKHALNTLIKSGIDPTKLIVGIGATNLDETISLNRQATDLKCHATLLMPPSYFTNVTSDSLFEYFTRVIESCPNSRIYVYNFPTMFQFSIAPSLMLKLMNSYPDQIVGMKDSSSDHSYLLKLFHAGVRGDLQPGNELIFEPYKQLMGTTGIITATANIIPKTLKRYIDNPDPELLKKLIAVRKALGGSAISLMKACLAKEQSEPCWSHVMPPLPLAEAVELPYELDCTSSS